MPTAVLVAPHSAPPDWGDVNVDSTPPDSAYGTFSVDSGNPKSPAAVWRSDSYDSDIAAEDALKMMEQSGFSRALARAPGENLGYRSK